MSSAPAQARASLIVAILLALAVLTCYSQVWGQHFLSYDDTGYVTNNPHVNAGLSLRSVAWAFTTRSNANWHPLTWLSHMADCQIYGLNATGHKITNVLFHAANSVLLFLLLRRMTGSLWRSAFVAALFALHPLHVQSVAWVSERKDVLSTFFAFLALWAYAGYAQRPNPWRYAAVAASMALSLMAKPTLVTLPFLLLLLDYWPLKRMAFSPGRVGRAERASEMPFRGETNPPLRSLPPSDIRTRNQRKENNLSPSRMAEPPAVAFAPLYPPYLLLLEKLPLLALSLASSIMTYFAQKAGGAVASFEHIPFHSRIANAAMTYLAYLGHTVWPAHLAFFYPRTSAWPVPDVALAAAFLIAVTVLALALARRWPALPVGWFWYLGTLVPMIGLVQVGDQAMADRYTYVPLVGIFLAVAWALPSRLFAQPAPRIAGAIVTLAILAALSFRTWTEVGYWQDDASLCLHALAAIPNNYVAEINYGSVLLESGQPAQALDYYRQGIKMAPQSPLAHYDCGRALAALQQIPEAIAEFQKSLTLRPQGSDAVAHIARLLQSQGKPAQALKALQSGAGFDPDNPKILIPLANALIADQQLAAAAKVYQHILEVQPDQVAIRNNLGTALDHLGRPREALDQYLQAIQTQPDNASFHENAAAVLAELQDYRAALDQLQEALRLNPDSPALQVKTGLLLAQSGNLVEAALHLAQACRLQPANAVFHNLLGEVLLQQGQIQDAQSQFTQALRLQPDFIEARKNLQKTREMLHGP